MIGSQDREARGTRAQIREGSVADEAEHHPNETDRETVIPRVEERATVDKRTVETGRVRVRTIVDEHEQWVREALTHEDIEIDRVTVGRRVESVPPVRTEGDTVIVPLVEEVVVIEKQLILAEEVHVRRRARVEQMEQPVTLRSTRIVVERPPSGNGG